MQLVMLVVVALIDRANIFDGPSKLEHISTGDSEHFDGDVLHKIRRETGSAKALSAGAVGERFVDPEVTQEVAQWAFPRSACVCQRNWSLSGDATEAVDRADDLAARDVGGL